MMIKKLLLHRIPVLGGLLLLLMIGLLNAQTRNLNTARSQNIQLIPQAEAPDSKAEQSVNALQGNPLEMMKGKAEDISKRTLDSKHFRNADGSFTAIIGAGPVHYQKNGKWEDINPNIITTDDAVYKFQNKTNLMESHFGSNSRQGVKSTTREGEVLEFQNVKMYWEVKKVPTFIQNANEVSAEHIGDKIIYPNIFNDIHAEYSVRIGQRKLNFIIPTKNTFSDAPKDADFLVFEEQIILPPNLRVKKEANGGINIINADNTIVYNYPKPEVLEDYQGSDKLPDLTTQPFFETEFNNGILILRIKVKTDWLFSDGRVFPLAIDPTVTVYPNNVTRWTKSVYSNGTEVATALYFGYQSAMFLNGHIRFNTSSIANGSIINSATGWINITAGTGTNPATRQWQFANSANPVTTTGAALFNSANLGYSTIVPVTGTGWRSSALYNPAGNTYIENSLVNNAVNLAMVPSGTYANGTYMTVDNYSSTNRPYLVINYFHALTVTNAYTGASLPNGRYGYDTNASVTVTSGTRAGYVCTGWIGTGSVPATGTTSSVTISMTQNSSVNWQWQLQPGNPDNITFHNYGGPDQLAFNNSRINTTTPIFRLSHQTDPATDYEIEINPSPTFAAGTSWVQTFTGTYPLNTPANFTFTNGFTPVTGTTYYVRVRVKGAANTYSAWTTESYSFTYETAKAKPDWFQTTQAQFATDALSGTTADTNNDVTVSNTGGNVITNGSFETNITGWTKSSSFAPGYSALRSTDWASHGVASLEMYNNAPGSNGYFTSDFVSMYQTVNLTGVNNLLMEADYAGQGSVIVQLRVYIAETTQSTGTTGTLVHTWTPPSNSSGSTINVDLTPYNFIGNKVLKIVYYVTGQETTTNMRYLNVDNIRTTSLPQGTITSTPIALSSVQNVTRFEKLQWNQTLGGGTLNFKIQHTTLGGTVWADVPGYTNISAIGDGLKEFDLSAMTDYPQIRLVGTLNGVNVKMHDWAVIYEESCDKTWSGSTANWATDNNWNPPGIPTAKNCVKIPSLPVKPTIQVGTDALAKNLTIESDGQLVVKGNLTVSDFINNGGSATDLTIESDGNLVQVNPATNTGDITLQRNSKMKRLDYIYWGSPVIGQTFLNFSPNTVASRFYRYNEEFDSFHTIANLNDPMIAGQGYAIRAPNNQHTTTPTSWTGIFKGKPNNGVITVPVTKHDDSPIDPNNPLSQLIPRGKNMLSNPYPSNLDLEALSDANPVTANGVYYFWTNTNDFVDNTQVPGNGEYGNYGSNHYATYSSSGAVPAANADSQLPTRYIRPGQGFLFQAKLGGTVTFNNSMRSIDSNSTFISNKGTENSPERFWLKLTTPINNSNTLLVAYISGATNSFEPRYDARFPQKSSDRFYSIIEDQELIIQGRQYPFVKTDLVSLGMAHFVSGNYKIEIADREGIFAADQNIYLKDRQTGIITNLSQESYTYSAQAGENKTRFEIIYEPETVLVTNDRTKGSCIIYRDATDFVVKSSDETIENIELYEASGRLILKVNGNNRKEVRFPAHQLQKGIYVLKAFTKGGIIIKKMINH